MKEQACLLQATKIHTADLLSSPQQCLQLDFQPLNLLGVSGKKTREGCKRRLQTSEATGIAGLAGLEPPQSEVAPNSKD